MRSALILFALAACTASGVSQQISARTAEPYTSLTTITTTTAVTSTITVYADDSTALASSPQPSATTAASAAKPIAAFPAPSMTYTSALDSAVLNSTNLYRTQYTADALSWNTTLADFAQSHAEKCIWQHSAIDAWAAEESAYDWSHPGFSEGTGHFTQLVWKNTTQVGCGAVQCNSAAGNGAPGWFLVCEYSPAGNVEGEYGDQVGKAGKSDDGELGLGGAGGSSRSSRVLVAMAAAYLALTICA
nr:protein pry1 [Quercus suber]